MTEYSNDDQWRSFQTFAAAYLAGMLHPLDVFTISRRKRVAAPILEFRCIADQILRLSIGDNAWSDEDGDFIRFSRQDVNQVAANAVDALRNSARIDRPDELRLDASGPASTVAVLAKGGFMSGNPETTHPARAAAQAARMATMIDVQGDAIEAAARVAGDRAFVEARNGSIAARVAALELARLRTWNDPFTVAPETGYLVGTNQADPTDEHPQ